MDMKLQQMTFVLIPAEELETLKQTQLEILNRLNQLKDPIVQDNPFTSEYIPAAAFMQAVNIKRTKFNELIAQNKIKTLKKCRKIYVWASEVNRFFSNSEIK